MGHIKIYGVAHELNSYKQQLSDVIHTCVVDSLKYPADKRFHRFFPMEKENFLFPQERTSKYTIIEISMFEGRSVDAKKSLINSLFAKLESEIGISPNDVEITIFETPKNNWGIRGVPGDELQLNYKVGV